MRVFPLSDCLPRALYQRKKARTWSFFGLGFPPQEEGIQRPRLNPQWSQIRFTAPHRVVGTRVMSNSRAALRSLSSTEKSENTGSLQRGDRWHFSFHAFSVCVSFPPLGANCVSLSESRTEDKASAFPSNCWAFHQHHHKCDRWILNPNILLM